MSGNNGTGFGKTVTAKPGIALGKTQMGDTLIGKVLDGRYQIEELLGEGGMGIVYRAVHTTLGKQLAIKVLRPDVSRNEEILARFKREAQSASAIGNQHIIDISDFGVLPDGSTYFVMEFLGGMSLTKAISQGRFPTERTVHIAKQLCSALGAAHDIGVVHRDLKPDNVQLIDRGEDKDFVKVLDFGIAKVGGASSKLTQAGQVFGTPHYMSPEQCAGSNVDRRTDVYALGVILYEMATGKVPFDADNLMGILTKHLYENAIPPREFTPPLNVPASLEAVIMKALAKKPEARYQTTAEMAADLDAVDKGATPKAVIESVNRGSTPASALGEDVRPSLVAGVPSQELKISKPIMPILIGVAALVLVGGGITAAVMLSGGKSAPETANVIKPAPQAAPQPAPKAEPARAAAPAEKPIKIKLTSVPSDVEVYSGDVLVGNTPYELDKPQGPNVVELVLRKEGFHEKKIKISSLTASSMRITLDKKREEVSQTLSPAAKQPERASKAKGKARASRESMGIGPTNEVLDPWK